MYQLPSDKAARKNKPVYSGVIKYFPLALAEVASVSKAGNDQHNPGQPLHWAREKSTDQLDAAVRHITDYALGNHFDDDGQSHLAKAAWRVLAQLQLDEELRIDELIAAQQQEEDWRRGTVWERPRQEVEQYIERLNEGAE